MKQQVMSLLAERELTHIFTEASFNSCKRKACKNSGGNKYLQALHIVDLLIVNYPAAA
jgi:hypothetical protein